MAISRPDFRRRSPDKYPSKSHKSGQIGRALKAVPCMGGAAEMISRVNELSLPTAMLHYAIVFIIVALIAGFLGFGALSGVAATIAKICFVLFLIFALFSFVKKKA